MKTIYATMRGVLPLACLLIAQHSFAQISFNIPATPAPGNISAIEYFIDTDPGKGAATSLSITAAQNVSVTTTLNIPSTLTPGIHQLWLRAKSGSSWGTAQKSLFVVRSAGAYFPAQAAKKDISAIEYFFDADSGIGKGQIVPVTATQLLQSFSFNANISALQNLKAHKLYVRTLSDGVSTAASYYFGKGISVLPIRLLTFTAQRLAEEVSLRWTTAEETGNDHFEVERSHDGISFAAIASLPAQGSGPGQKGYMSTDAAPFEGRNYYRLKQVDKSGSFSYSPIVAVQFSGGAAGISFNNPAGNELHIRNAAPGAGLSILDGQGRLLKAVTMTAGEQSIDISALPAGSLILRYELDGASEAKHLLKQ